MKCDMTPKIYVACLAAYNNGYLHGAWIDAMHDVDDIYDEIKKILASSPIPNSEEFEIHDFEGFGDFSIHEYASIDNVAAYAQFVQQHGDLGAALLVHTAGDIDEATSYIEDHYHGEYDSEEDFAYQLAQDTMEMPKHLEYYIDYQSMARDFFINDYFSINVNHQVHVFSY